MDKHYHVTWGIDIFADSTENAARQALEIQRDPESTALVFCVRDVRTDEVEQLDLLEQGADEVILPNADEQGNLFILGTPGEAPHE